MLSRLRQFFAPSAQAINAWLESWQLSQLTRWQRRRLQRRFQRQLGYWRRWATSPDSRGRFSRIGWQLVPRILGAAQKYTDQSSTSTQDRLLQSYLNAAIQLSDGTLVFIDHDGAGGSGHWFLKYSSDHSTINTIASNLESIFTSLTSSSSFITVVRDSADNLYVVGSGPTSHVTVKAYTKGAGYTWTAQTALNTTTTTNKSIGVALWLNTTGGTNSKGHLIVALGQIQTAGTQAYVLDAGAAVAGSGTLEISSTANPTFLGANQCSGLLDLDADGFGGTSGVSVCGNAANASATCAVVNIGAWAINSSGAFTTNSAISSNVSIGSITVPGSLPGSSKARVIRYASNAFAIVAPSTTAGRYFLARYSGSAQLTAFTDSGAPANLPLNAATLKWDAFLDPATANKVWVIANAALSGSTVQVYRLGCSVGSGVTWDAAVTTDDSLTGLSTSTPSDLRAVKVPISGSVDWQLFVQTSATVFALYGDYTQFDSGPSAPTLTAPANGAVADLAAGATAFTWTYNHPQSIAEGAWAMRIKVSGGSYNYIRTSDNTLQSTIVWNTGSATSYTPPAALLSDGGTVYNWSVATQDNLGLQGPFASDFTVTGANPPTVTVTSPSGSVVLASPAIAWTFSPGTGGDTQLNYQVKLEHGTYGTTPGSGTQDWDSGVIADSSGRSLQVGVALSNGVTYRAFVRVTESNGLISSWAYTTFTVSFDVPAAPKLVASYDAVLNRIVLTLNGLDNLLSTNQASLETDTTGWAANTNCAISRVTAQALDGAASLQLSSTAAGDMSAITPTGTSGVAVQPSTQYTGLVSFRTAVSARNCQVTVLWYTAAGAFISNMFSANVTDGTGGWIQANITGTSPANAAFAAVQVTVTGTGAASEIHYVDCIALLPGSSTTWTRGGLVGGQVFYLYSSDDGAVTWQFIRGGNNLAPAAGPAQLVTAYDYEATPKATRQYRAFTTASSGTIISLVSNVVSATPAPSSFWLKYPINPALNMAINVDPPLPHSRPEMTTSFPVLGGTKMLVGADTLLGHQNAGLTCHVNSLAQWTALQALLVTQDVLLLESPFGEHWYIRIGSAGGSGGGSHRSYELHGPDYSDANNQYRKATFPYVEVAAPATP